MPGTANLNNSVEDEHLYQLELRDDLEYSAENSMLIQSSSPKYLQYVNQLPNQISKKTVKQGGGHTKLITDFSPTKIVAGTKQSADLHQAQIIKAHTDAKRSFIKRGTQPPGTALVRNSKVSLIGTKNESMLRAEGSTGNIGKAQD